MNLLDARTVMISYILSNAINAIVIFVLWLQNHKRFAGIGFWLADYFIQFAAVILIVLRDSMPVASILLGNSLVIGGTILLYIGLERFVDKRGPQLQNAFLLAAFLAAHAYFLFVYPSLEARNINLSISLIAICGQGVWLMLRRSTRELRPVTFGPGLVFAAYCLASLLRIVVDLFVPSGNDFFHSNVYDTLVLMTYQMLFVGLTFTLILMVNRRLFKSLEDDINLRGKVEEALRLSEEKLSKAFHASPDAVLITRASDGRLLEVNDGFSRLTEYSREEALASTTIQLALWANPQDRATYLAALEKNRSIRNDEYDLRTKSGRILHCQHSGEFIFLNGEAHIVSVVHDITERNQAEEILRRSEANFREVFDNAAQGIFIIEVIADGDFRIRDVNPAQEMLSGILRENSRGMLLDHVLQTGPAQALRVHCLRCLEAESSIAVEEEVDLPAGRKYIYTTLAPVRDETGRIYRIIGSTLDITERKRVEEILHLRLNLWEYAAAHTVDELMQKSLDEIEGITGSPVGFYHFVEEDQRTLSLHAWSTRTLREFCTAQGQGMHYDLDRAGVWADCVRERKPIIHNDYNSLPNRKGMPEGHAKIVRELVVPTLRGGSVVSVLGVGNKPSEYEQKDVELLSYIADIVWVIIDRKRTEEKIQRLQSQLREMAIHDSLTGLYNRHYLAETLKRELARATREKYPVSFIMIDIDYFKRVNDTFGHKAGDEVLEKLAAQLLASSRASDIIFRYGGEEFLAILPKAKGETAHLIAEKWRKNFHESTMLLEHGGVKVSISCGIATFPRHGEIGVELIAHADQALYQAKTAGRNRSVVWKKAASPSTPHPHSAI
jgi:diguanylate cyclase (GGDEF)-like protein/PAS domain S-box-containing protein